MLEQLGAPLYPPFQLLLTAVPQIQPLVPRLSKATVSACSSSWLSLVDPMAVPPPGCGKAEGIAGTRPVRETKQLHSLHHGSPALDDKWAEIQRALTHLQLPPTHQDSFDSQQQVSFRRGLRAFDFPFSSSALLSDMSTTGSAYTREVLSCQVQLPL